MKTYIILLVLIVGLGMVGIEYVGSSLTYLCVGIIIGWINTDYFFNRRV